MHKLKYLLVITTLLFTIPAFASQINTGQGVTGISGGGTNATSQTTNGVNYFDGTKITSGSVFTFNGTNVGIGTSLGLAKLDINGGTVTTNSPVLNLSQTWNQVGTNFRGAEINITNTSSAFPSTPLRINVGGSDFFHVDQFGLVQSNSGYNVGGDTYLTRVAAANWRFGNNDAASPVAQTISVQNVVGGTSNTAGTALTISGSRGTGTGLGGDIIFNTAPASTTGSTQNTLVTAVTIKDSGNVGIGTNAPVNRFDVYNGCLTVGYTGVIVTCNTSGITANGTIGGPNFDTSGVYKWHNSLNSITGDAVNDVINVFRSTDATMSIGIGTSNATVGVNPTITGVNTAGNISMGIGTATPNAALAVTAISGNDIFRAGTVASPGILTLTNAGGLNFPGGNFVANNVTVIGRYLFSGSSQIFAGTDGTIRFTNSASTGFTRFQLGTTTSTSPAIGITGTTLNVQLADGTAGGALTVGTNTLRNSSALDVQGGLNISGAINAAGLSTTSAAQTGTVCWTTGTGNFTVDTTTTCLLSSLRFKKDIQPIGDALTEISQLHPITFVYKDPAMGPDRLSGLIAEEANPIDHTIVELDKEGKPYKVRYEGLTVLNTRAIQQLMGQVAHVGNNTFEGAIPYHKCVSWLPLLCASN